MVDSYVLNARRGAKMFYTIIYIQENQNVLEVLSDVRKMVYKLLSLKQKRVKAHIEYNVDAVIVNGEHI